MIDIFSHEYFMREALKEAKLAQKKGEVPIGSVIILNNKIISKSHNLVETLRDVTAHSEILSITSASSYLNSKYLENCSIYITMEPCFMCFGALYLARIPKIIYSLKDKKKGAISNGINLNSKVEIIEGILAEESNFLLKSFFKEIRK